MCTFMPASRREKVPRSFATKGILHPTILAETKFVGGRVLVRYTPCTTGRKGTKQRNMGVWSLNRSMRRGCLFHGGLIKVLLCSALALIGFACGGGTSDPPGG